MLSYISVSRTVYTTYDAHSCVSIRAWRHRAQCERTTASNRCEDL